MSYRFIFTFDDWQQSVESFQEYAAIIGYPNLRVSDTNKYDGYVDFINIRTGETIFQGFDGIFIEFEEDGTINFYSGVNKGKCLYSYKENVTKITEADNEKNQKTVERFKAMGLSKLKPYDNLHRPAVGSVVIRGNDTFAITAVETIPDCSLLYITVGQYRVRSDDFLKYFRYDNAEMCGWKEELKTD